MSRGMVSIVTFRSLHFKKIYTLTSAVNNYTEIHTLLANLGLSFELFIYITPLMIHITFKGMQKNAIERTINNL